MPDCVANKPQKQLFFHDQGRQNDQFGHTGFSDTHLATMLASNLHDRMPLGFFLANFYFRRYNGGNTDIKIGKTISLGNDFQPLAQ